MNGLRIFVLFLQYLYDHLSFIWFIRPLEGTLKIKSGNFLGHVNE